MPRLLETAARSAAFALIAQCALAASLGESLVQAARDEDGALVADLLQGGTDPDSSEPDGATALAWAALRGDADIASLLLESGADPNAANVLGISPLAMALENGAEAVVSLLLASGADANRARENGQTPLMTAARLGQTGLMELLLDHGADPDARERNFGQTALMWAAGNPGAVSLLLRRGANAGIKTRTWDVRYTIYAPTTFTLGKTGIPWNTAGEYASPRGGHSALFFAIRKREPESVRLLLDAGIDVNDRAADGTTPLLAALYNWVPLDDDFQPGQGAPAQAGSSQRFGPDLEIANLLLDHGSSSVGADSAGYTPLHAAALAVAWSRGPKQGGSKGVYRHLAALLSLKRAAEGEARFGPSESVATVRRILAGGGDPNQPTQYTTPGPTGDVRINPAPPGSTALHIAADSGSTELVRLLLEAGGDANQARKDGHSPFSVAVVARDLPVIQEMVAHGADLEAVYDPDDRYPDPHEAISLSRSGQTIAHLAAANRFPEVVKYLHSQGARLDLKNDQGETPLDLADHQERFQEALERQNTDGDEQRLLAVERKTETTDLIRSLLSEHGAVRSAGP